MWKMMLLFFLPLFIPSVLSANSSQSDQSALMNIWNYDIKRNVKTTVAYKQWDLAVWEEVIPTSNTTADRRYYVTPPVVLLKDTARCDYVSITDTFDVSYDVQLWERELPRAVSERLKEMGIDIKEDQISPLPFYQARIVWNSPNPLKDLKLSPSWINNLQQQKTYTFSVTAANNASCQNLVDTIRKNPAQFVNPLQLQFTVSAAKIDSKLLEIKSEHVENSQLVATLKNMPGAEGTTRFLSSNDYNRMLLQVANQVVANEITSGDYVDADDELSLKDTIANFLNTQKENTAQFDDKMWNSTFWDPLNERPDQVTKEMNKYFKLNTTDNRWYMTSSDMSSTAANVDALAKFGWSAGASHTSQSSKTTDDMRHLLEEYNIESEIDGNQFIPKKLDLTRLNMNDLTRKDALTSKRVRVRQVDIGGVLQVAVGNSTTGEMDDENRFLRQQLNKMQETIKQMNAFMKEDLKSAMSELRNDTESAVSELRNDTNRIMESLIDQLAHSPSSNSCSSHSSASLTFASNPVCSAFLSGSEYASRQITFELFNKFGDVRCSAGKVLTQFHMDYKDTPTGIDNPKRTCDIFMTYTCCSLL